MSHHDVPVGDPQLARRLSREVEGEVRFDAFSRARYSTDASVYQIEPVGVVIPRSVEDVRRTLEVAAEAGVPVIPRGAGTSQAGQAVGRGLVVDTSPHLRTIHSFDPDAGIAVVDPGVVMADLNTLLEEHGLWFPVDVSTANRATLGGMTANNSAGTRSLRYGVMTDWVRGVEGFLGDGRRVAFGSIGEGGPAGAPPGVEPAGERLAQRILAVARREADELARRIPRVPRHVAGYDLHRISGGDVTPVLVGSEGTLAFFTRVHLALAERPPHRVLGVCHFPSLTAALDAVQDIVTLEPSAVELVDGTLLGLAAATPEFADKLRSFVRGDPAALLITEFQGGDPDGLRADLRRLADLVAGLRFPGSVVDVMEPAGQDRVWAVRRAGLNIVMSMRGDEKPVSFLEDCTVPLPRLAEYATRLSRVFRRHGAEGTWYAHASVGCLHVRPALNLKTAAGASAMRAIAEEAHALVREFGGSHSGEHGDGIVRSEFIEPMLGSRLARAFEEVKEVFDPEHRLNPGKIVAAPRMDDRRLFRYPPGYAARALPVVLDWSAWGGLAGAAEMCNNNGACRKFDAGSMCPSYRVTRDEAHVTRGRANVLRLALTGQLGEGALTSREMHEALELCVACKACRRECPTGVDVARMKVEVLHLHRVEHGVRLRDRLLAHLPRWAPWGRRLRGLLHLRRPGGLAARLGERFLGVAAERALPEWSATPFAPALRGKGTGPPKASSSERPVAVLADTFTTWFEPENGRALLRVVTAAGFEPHVLRPTDGGRPLCCGRTYLSKGMVEEARAELGRLLEAAAPWAQADIPLVGLEPSCLLTLRDEVEALFPNDVRAAAVTRAARMWDELLVVGDAGERLAASLGPVDARALVHGHCHQKAFDADGATLQALRLVPGLGVTPIASSCCGMAGAFGYEAEHREVSLAMAELDLLPAVRDADPDTRILASGTSCRHQIHDGTGREAVHPVRLMAEALQG